MERRPPVKPDRSRLETVAARLAGELYGGRWIVKARPKPKAKAAA